MEEIVAQIVKELGIKLLEANLSFVNEADRFDIFESKVREACTATAAEFLSRSLTDLDESIRKCVSRDRYSIQRRREPGTHKYGRYIEV